VEVLLVRPGEEANRWQALVRGHVRSGQQVELPHGVLASVTTAGEGGHAVIIFPDGLDVLAYAEKAGQVPLPPYIHRAPVEDDRLHYQTVFARRPGAVAAPTAGLHFTEPLLQALTAHGVRTGYVTLHVGPGTFKPVTCEDIRRHVMDPEWYELPPTTAKLVNESRAAGGRIVAVGSTAVRVLETAAQNGLPLEAGAGETGLFIYPGFRFSVVDVLLTNFHLPKSTLFMLVCALAGRERMLEAYRAAAAERYRFYSYGDAMLIL
jgi:S-adenosylmethionine:tRNA ribosyltransferase-isomerase